MKTQDYVNLIINFVNDKYGKVYVGKFKKFHVVNYCLDMSDEFVNQVKLNYIVDYTLKYLVDNNYLIKFKHCFMTIKLIDIPINLKFDNNDSKNIIKKKSKSISKLIKML